MTIKILMPALSPTMTEGNLVAWHKQEGDTIQSGDLLAEIETDKATMEVEAVDEGVLGKILVPAGTSDVKVNSVIAVLLEEGETPDDIDVADEESQVPSSEASSVGAAGHDAPGPDAVITEEVKVEAADVGEVAMDQGRVLASPLARRIAQQNGLSLDTVRGSGPRGRIIKADVLRALEGGGALASGGAAHAGHKVGQQIANVQGGGYRDVPLSNMRKIVAQRLTESKQTIPHFYLTLDIIMDPLLDVRKRLNAVLEDEQRFSVNDFILKACAMALRDVPEANAAWMGSALRYYDDVDIAIAVAIEGGLITPILRGAQRKSLREISAEAKVLIQKARSNKLAPHEFQGGTFSLSNMGMYGVTEFSAILNPPQACILAVGAAEKRPIVRSGGENKEDVVTIATVGRCTASVDHRVIDGAVAASFMAAFKRYVENPLLMLI